MNENNQSNNTLPEEKLETPITSEDQLTSREFSVEDKNAFWFNQIFKGQVPQLTIRAVLTGMILGGLLSIINLYVGLQVGFGLGLAIIAVVIAFILFKWLVPLFNLFMGKKRFKEFHVLENVMLQSTSSAASYMAGAGLVSAIPALIMIMGNNFQLEWWELMLWMAGISYLGLFLAIPMKQQMINDEQLPFPPGIAAAETLKALHQSAKESLQQGLALLYGAIFALINGFIINFIKGIPHGIKIPTSLFGVKPIGLQPQFTVFPLDFTLAGIGALIGPRVGFSLLIMGILNFVVLGPILVSNGIVEVASNSYEAYIRQWALWPGSAIMVFAGLTTFVLRGKSIAKAFKSIGGLFRGSQSGESESPYQRIYFGKVEIPILWFVVGTILMGAFCVVLQLLLFDISWWLASIAIVFAFLLSLICTRAVGETAINPIGPMGKITQLVYAVIAPGSAVTNLSAANIAGGSANASADLLVDIKTGYLLGTSPRKQFIAQMFGIITGAIVSVPLFYLLVPDGYSLPDPEQNFPRPDHISKVQFQQSILNRTEDMETREYLNYIYTTGKYATLDEHVDKQIHRIAQSIDLTNPTHRQPSFDLLEPVVQELMKHRYPTKYLTELFIEDDTYVLKVEPSSRQISKVEQLLQELQRTHSQADFSLFYDENRQIVLPETIDKKIFETGILKNLIQEADKTWLQSFYELSDTVTVKPNLTKAMYAKLYDLAKAAGTLNSQLEYDRFKREQLLANPELEWDMFHHFLGSVEKETDQSFVESLFIQTYHRTKHASTEDQTRLHTLFQEAQLKRTTIDLAFLKNIWGEVTLPQQIARDKFEDRLLSLITMESDRKLIQQLYEPSESLRLKSALVLRLHKIFMQSRQRLTLGSDISEYAWLEELAKSGGKLVPDMIPQADFIRLDTVLSNQPESLALVHALYTADERRVLDTHIVSVSSELPSSEEEPAASIEVSALDKHIQQYLLDTLLEMKTKENGQLTPEVQASIGAGDVPKRIMPDTFETDILPYLGNTEALFLNTYYTKVETYHLTSALLEADHVRIREMLLFNPDTPVAFLSAEAAGFLLPENLTQEQYTTLLEMVYRDTDRDYIESLYKKEAYYSLKPDLTTVTLQKTTEILNSIKHPAPAAMIWYSVAKVLTDGLSALPPGALIAMIIASLLGILIAILEHFLPAIRKWLPNAIGVGTAMIIPFHYSFVIFLGAFVAWVVSKVAKDIPYARIIAVGAGILAVGVILQLITVGLRAIGIDPAFIG